MPQLSLIAYAPSQNITKEKYQRYSGPVPLDLHNSTLCVVVRALFCPVFNVDASLIYKNPCLNKLTFFDFVSFTKSILCKNKSFTVSFNFFLITEFLKLFFWVSLVCLIYPWPIPKVLILRNTGSITVTNYVIQLGLIYDHSYS